MAAANLSLGDLRTWTHHVILSTENKQTSGTGFPVEYGLDDESKDNTNPEVYR